jgi:sterol desaturase/sphingolipid hydroxylase (fatty acid hydroxylase superfamily)
MKETIHNPSIRSEENRIFQNGTLEKLTHTNSIVAIFVYCISAIGMIVYGISNFEISFRRALWLLLGGRFVFTFIEYLMHRYVYHSGESMNNQTWQYKVHGIHHQHPKVKSQLAMPLPIGILLLTAFYFIFTLVMRDMVWFFFPGFVLGYSFYLLMHYLIHTLRAPKNYLKYFWWHHHMHHAREDKAYGLSTRFWDRVFGTMPPKPRKKRLI